LEGGRRRFFKEMEKALSSVRCGKRGMVVPLRAVGMRIGYWEARVSQDISVGGDIHDRVQEVGEVGELRDVGGETGAGVELRVKKWSALGCQLVCIVIAFAVLVAFDPLPVYWEVLFCQRVDLLCCAHQDSVVVGSPESPSHVSSPFGVIVNSDGIVVACGKKFQQEFYDGREFTGVVGVLGGAKVVCVFLSDLMTRPFPAFQPE
jgi:hypothetical protein